MNLPCIVGLLLDENGQYYHHYREDSYVCDEEYIAPTLKSYYNQNCSFWVIVRGRDDDTGKDR